MNGRIRAESKVGEGSVFTVELRLPVDRSAVTRVRIAPVDVSGARVLAIDDNPVNRSILMEQMSAWGFDACAAVSGREGLDVLAAARDFGVPVDVVILDYHMPEMDGAMTARAIRKAFGPGKPAIVMLTSMDLNTSDADIRQGVVQAALMKPARSSLLLETIVGVLQAAAQDQAGAVAEAPAAAVVSADRQISAAPPVRPAVVAARSEKPERGLPAVKAGDNRGLDLLVAEDNEVNQIVFTQILDEMGLHYRIVDNGGSAFDVWKSHRPAMILMDVSMPVMNGHQATQAIRKAEAEDGNLGRTPIVGVTAHALTGDKERCLEAGMDDYLSKPISPEKLEAKIRDWLPEDIAARITHG